MLTGDNYLESPSCGIGFTMSLFIGSLAFGGMDNPLAGLDRLGILSGSIVSAVVGFIVLEALPEKSLVTRLDSVGLKKPDLSPANTKVDRTTFKSFFHQSLCLTDPVITLYATSEFHDIRLEISNFQIR